MTLEKLEIILNTYLFPSKGVSLVHGRPRPESLSYAAEPERKWPIVLDPVTDFRPVCDTRCLIDHSSLYLFLSLTLVAHCLHCFSSRQSPAALARPGSSGLSFRSNHFRLWRQNTHADSESNKYGQRAKQSQRSHLTHHVRKDIMFNYIWVCSDIISGGRPERKHQALLFINLPLSLTDSHGFLSVWNTYKHLMGAGQHQSWYNTHWRCSFMLPGSVCTNVTGANSARVGHPPWAERSWRAGQSACCCTGPDVEGWPGSPGHLADRSAGFYSDPPSPSGSGCRTLATWKKPRT